MGRQAKEARERYVNRRGRVAVCHSDEPSLVTEKLT